MFSYIWPLVLIIFSNVLYQICAKSIPSGMNPFAALTVTYFVSALMSLVLYYSVNKDAKITLELSKVN